MQNLIPKELRHIDGIVAVGGAVRDMLRGVSPSDIDLASPIPATELAEILKKQGFKVIETGLKHGTITVMIKGQPFEITTFRTDHNCDGRHAEVKFVTDLKTDLARRDFTINAMAVDADGRLFDPFGGQADLENGLIRCVGEASKRFSEDWLRIIRAWRFSCVFDFNIALGTFAAMEELNAEFLNAIFDSVSIERVTQEIEKVWEKADDPTRFLRFAWEFGLIERMIPEFKGADSLLQAPEHHPEGNVWEHTLMVVKSAEKGIKWQALLHDIGKMQTAQPSDHGEWFTFHGHEKVGAEMIDAIADRLKFSNELRESCKVLTRHHMTPLHVANQIGNVLRVSDKVIRKFRVAVGNHLKDLHELNKADRADRTPINADDLFTREIEMPIESIAKGRHFPDFHGTEMCGKLVKEAFRVQIEDGISDLQTLVSTALNNIIKE